MATTWADIQRLASDLQQIQLSESSKKLAESNCVEVVMKLMELEMLNLVVTTDAKEYVTLEHLRTEIRNECAAAGERIALTELAARLRVDLSHVERAVAIITKDGGYILTNDELFHRSFIDDLCARINSKLRETGQISLLQLTRAWDVPAEFISNFILPEIGRRVQAIRFGDNFYTNTFIHSLKRQLIAILTALTKTTALSAIHAHLNVSEALFFKVWNELTEIGQIPAIGQLLGTKNSLRSFFVPLVHSKLSKTFVRSALVDKGFIDSSILKKLNIVDQTALFKELFPREEDYERLLFLPSGIIDSDLWTEIENAFNESMATQKFCIVEECLSSSLGFLRKPDIERIVALLLKKASGASANHQWRATADYAIVYDEAAILDSLVAGITTFIEEKAKRDAPAILSAMKLSNQQQQQLSGKTARKATTDDDDWGKAGKKKAGGKKSTTSKSKAHKEEPFHGDSRTAIMSLDEDELSATIYEVRNAMKQPLPEALVHELADEIRTHANALFRAAVNRCFNSAETAAADEKRRTHEQIQQQARAIYVSICAFEYGANALAEELAVELKSHLLKTLGVELANVVLDAFSNDISSRDLQKVTLNVKLRNERISSISEPKCQEALQRLYNSVQQPAINEFHEAVDSLRDFSFLLRQPDKTTRHEFLHDYCVKLRQQIFPTDSIEQSISDSAPLLLLSVILFCFGHFHRLAIHASGKFVNHLSAYLLTNNKKDGKAKLLISATDANDDNGENEERGEIIPSNILECILDTQRRVVALLSRRRAGHTGDENDDENAEHIQQNIATLRTFLIKTSVMSK